MGENRWLGRLFGLLSVSSLIFRVKVVNAMKKGIRDKQWMLGELKGMRNEDRRVGESTGSEQAAVHLCTSSTRKTRQEYGSPVSRCKKRAESPQISCEVLDTQNECKGWWSGNSKKTNEGAVVLDSSAVVVRCNGKCEWGTQMWVTGFDYGVQGYTKASDCICTSERRQVEQTSWHIESGDHRVCTPRLPINHHPRCPEHRPLPPDLRGMGTGPSTLCHEGR